MNLSNKGYKFICRQEGVRNLAYQDSVKIWTVGIGFIKINGEPVVKGMRLTDAQIEEEFYKQIGSYESIVNESVHSQLNQNQFDALVSFCFNVGSGNFKSSTLLKVVNANPNNPEINLQFNKWCRAGGEIIPGLLNRRINEGELYFTK